MSKKKSELTRREVLAAGVAAGSALSMLPKRDASAGGVGMQQDKLEIDDITSLSAKDLSRAIRARAVSCEEVMRAYIDRIDRVNPTYNAIILRQDSDYLIDQAKEKDVELAAGQYAGWMHGFPHAVKDLADVKGLPTTEGSPILKDNIAEADSIFVERLRRAGAIFIGKTNTPEFGLGSQSYNPVSGVTLNAYDGKSTAGGSSGGAAVALAKNLVPVADGSDMMGSLRNPAAFNNVIGFRPSLGRVPLRADFMVQLAVAGPMGRNVADTAMLLSIMAGYDDRDPLSINVEPAQFTADLARDFAGTRIGWLGDFDGYLPMEDGVLDLCHSALSVFEDMGCAVGAAHPDYSMSELWQTWLTLRHWAAGGFFRELYDDPDLRKLLKPEVIWETEGSLNQTGHQIDRARDARNRWYQAVLELFREFDYLVLPSAQVFPFDADIHWPKEIAGVSMDTYHRWMEVVIPGTLSGCPIINVPVGFSPGGKPMGMQIIGPMKRDLDVLQIASAYEQRARWNLDG